MTDLLQEVDDMMRRERMEKLWNEHGNFIIGAVVTIILATAIFSGLKSWNSHVRMTQTQILMNALENDNFAANASEIASTLRPGLKAITLLNAAGAKLSDKKPEEALALLKSVAEDGGTPDDLRGLAVVMQARLVKPEEHKAVLEALTEIYKSSSNPWRFHAALEAAVLKAGGEDYKTAREILATILDSTDSDAQLPPGLLDRARALDHVYEVKSGQTAPVAKEAQEG